jgi:hypothetical protein
MLAMSAESSSYSISSSTNTQLDGSHETLAAAAEAAVQGSLQVAGEGGSLAEPGALQWVQLHGQAVAAIAASNFVVVSVGLEGSLKVREINSPCMKLQSVIRCPVCMTDIMLPQLHVEDVCLLWL